MDLIALRDLLIDIVIALVLLDIFAIFAVFLVGCLIIVLGGFYHWLRDMLK